jgi:uncharacterized protein (TIGR02145 family)
MHSGLILNQMKHILTISLCFLALSLSAYGQNNYSMSFDGNDDYLETFDSVFTPNGNDLTVMAFVKSQDQSNSDEQETIISWYRCGSDCNSPITDKGALYKIEVNDNMLQWKLRGDTDGETDDMLVAEAPYDEFFGDGNWHQIAGTFERATSMAILYIDGVAVDSDSSFQLDLMSSGTISIPLAFGYTSLDPAFFPVANISFFNGWIDDVMIWSSALTQQEIQQYMNCPPSGDEEGLVGYWNFDEGSGTTAFDQTPNGNDGTINGATWSTDTPEQNCLGDCTDSVACNFNSNADYDDGSCEYFTCKCLNGTVWSDELEGCIVENPTDSNLDGCTDLSDLLNLLSAYGDCAVSEFTCGDLVSHEGYDYSTVQIGDQCWFSENCRYLPEVSPSSEGSETEPYYYVYGYEGNDVGEAIATANYETYGVLYNWPVVMTDEICPSDWHVPTDAEFTQLTDFLGGESVAGDAMKSTSGWNGGGNGSNSSGFEGLPGGIVSGNIFVHYLNDAYFWSSTAEGDSYAWYRNLYYLNSIVDRNYYLKSLGRSARCIKH